MKKIIPSIFATVIVASTISFSQSSSFKDKLSSHSTNSQIKRGVVSMPDSAASFFWDNNVWQINDTSGFTYDNEGYEVSNRRTSMGNILGLNTKTYNNNYEILENLNQSYDANSMSFVNMNRQVSVFDVQGNQIENTYETWNTLTNLWEISDGIKSTYTYNSNNKIIEQIDQQYNFTSMLFENSNKSITTYDLIGNVISIEWFDYNTSVWEKSNMELYSYDSQNILTTFIIQTWDGNAYVNEGKYYNVVWQEWLGRIDDSNVLSYTEATWANNAWSDAARNNYIYDSNGGYIATKEDYVGGVWVYSSRDTKGVDSRLNNTGYRYEEWLNGSWSIIFEDKNIYTYDINGNMIQQINQNWDGANMALSNNKRTDYWSFNNYTNSLSINEISNSNLINIYPNPAISNLNVAITASNLSDKAEFIITDISGKIVIIQNASSNFSVNIQDIKNGLYFYTLIDNSSIINSGRVIFE